MTYGFHFKAEPKIKNVDSEYEGARLDMSLEEIKEILCKRFEMIDYAQAKDDVLPFIQNPASLDLWGKDFFCDITENLAEQ